MTKFLCNSAGYGIEEEFPVAGLSQLQLHTTGLEISESVWP
jgi:hypothetical protein